jgi:DNA-binding IclR family transcriptional regulator
MTITPKLTPRQRAFLDKLLELYREHRGPVHYSDVAERLGVNRFSAYDMLKVLENKGLASSSYTLRSAVPATAAGSPGPGRSMVVFAPTSEAAALLAPEDDRLGEEWRKVRERVLGRLQGAAEANYREAIDDLLARLPEARAPLVFCTEMIGALLLNMQRARTRAGGLGPFRALVALRASGDAVLETLAGLSVGATLATDDEAEPALTQRLLDQARRYQSNLSGLSAEARTALVQFLEEALEALD